MTKELVERLRRHNPWLMDQDERDTNMLLVEAADAIEGLELEKNLHIDDLIDNYEKEIAAKDAEIAELKDRLDEAFERAAGDDI